ncbi:MAG: hypothetical protein K8T10_17335 [Candidatus Eremiobacteraeota bacterium]|nr:hypothetical protein [Candidatus Eremiobacteraeota bacterium]
MGKLKGIKPGIIAGLLIAGNAFIIISILSHSKFLKTYISPTFTEIAKITGNNAMLLHVRLIPIFVFILSLIPCICLIYIFRKKFNAYIVWGVVSFITLQFVTWFSLMLTWIAIQLPNLLRLGAS